jgi:hypothetical protein
MRSTAKLLFLSLPFAGALAGCEARDLCTEYAALCNGAGGAGGGTVTTSQGGNAGSGGSGGSVDPGCHPSVLGDGVPLPDTCDGVFVKAGAAAGNGSRATPYGTLGEALADAGATKPIYVCNAADALAENPVVTVSTSLYGGLDCTTWSRTGTKTPLNGAADLAALTIQGSVTVTVEDFVITAANASGTVPGANSTGVFVDGADVTLDELEIVAGDGAAGAAGVTPTAVVTGGTNGVNGSAGCTSSANIAGQLSVNTICGTETSTSGNGGNGTVSGGMSSNAAAGDSDPPAPGAVDNHGNGQTSGSPCGFGTTGATGGDGAAGLGAGMSDWGTLTAEGYAGPPGQSGLGTGHPGQGGGGGGGARGASSCVTTTFAGPSGGSGGSGGCGGNPATGGGAGGSSIAIAARDGSLSLGSVTMTLGAGATGGAGAQGQSGATGGSGSSGGGSGACGGGPGGSGGFGGAGGGGRGGHALAVVLSGTAAPNLAGLSVSGGSFGTGGAQGGTAGNGGADGAVCKVLDIDAGTCTP